MLLASCWAIHQAAAIQEAEARRGAVCGMGWHLQAQQLHADHQPLGAVLMHSRALPRR